MSELTDLIVQAAGGNVAIGLILVGLFALNVWQTRHFDKRFESVETRVRRAENYLMEGQLAYTDGGEPAEEERDDE